MKRLSIVLFTLIATVSTYGCGSSGSIKGEKDLLLTTKGIHKRVYSAHTIIFRRGKSPTITESSFSSVLESSSGAGVKSYRFKNRFGQEENNSGTVVVLAIAGPRAGFGIYDNKGNLLVEYAKGVVMGDAVIFETKTGEGANSARWFFGTNQIISSIEAYNLAGDLVYSEITTYNTR